MVWDETYESSSYTRLREANDLKPTGKKEDDDDRVDDGEPMNVEVGHLKVRVPPRRPPHLAPAELHLVTEYHVGRACSTQTAIVSNEQGD